MVLVDTSVWIRFLAGRPAYVQRLGELLSREDVLGHPFVHGELLVGDSGSRARLLRDYAVMSQAAVVPHDEVVAFVKRGRIGARGLGFIDAHLLAATLVGGAQLWSADAALADVARELGVAYQG